MNRSPNNERPKEFSMQSAIHQFQQDVAPIMRRHRNLKILWFTHWVIGVPVIIFIGGIAADLGGLL